jgi:hypothetical protein
MTTDRPPLSPTEDRCTDYLCSITDLGRTYTVLDAPPELRGTRMVDYTLDQFFARLAVAGTGERPPREQLLEETRAILESMFGRGDFPLEGTMRLGIVFGDRPQP